MAGTVVGRYALHELIGSGGMARVYVGRLEGWAGFSKAVAVKRLHPDLALDPEFSAMLLDEARLSAHIRHPNVVSTLDVIHEEGTFLLIMDYVVGVSLHVLLKRSQAKELPIPDGVISAITVGILSGLHAAHVAADADGRPLCIVHRDMSPQNVILEESGLAKILDFGIATATERLTTTKEGSVKGKPSYIAPEQLARGPVDRRADIYAVGVMLWEMLAGRRLRPSATFAEVMDAFERGETAEAIAHPLGDIAMRAMHRDPDERYSDAASMAAAIEAALPPSPASAVSAWCRELAPDVLEIRRSAALRVEVPESVDAPSIAQVETRVQNEPTDETRSPRSARRWRFVAAALTLLLTVVVAFAITRARPVHPDATRRDTVASEPMTTAPAPSVAATPSVTMTAPSPPVVVAAPVEPRPRPVRPTTHAASAKSADAEHCRVPFRIDSNGMKIPKRECL